jgi:NAD(P)-dependent dehydrogenase (short-subunit alcohol dehydrogenase family)/acyl carrier protein
MLALDQDIESDLGIDSIKRVEIITTLREAHPSLENIGDEQYYEEMAQLETLGDIVEWIEKMFASPPSKSDRIRAVQPRNSISTAAESTIDKVDCQTLLFEIISDRTQYPVEMLALDQGIESDLGIDSIKRVEIITRLRESHPKLEDISNEKYYEEMAQLETLGDLVEWIEKTFGMPEKTPERIPESKAENARPDNSHMEVIIKTADPHVEKMVIDTISERTLYPAELIELELDLEEDLGIDADLLTEIISILIDTHAIFAGIPYEELQNVAKQLKNVKDMVNWLTQAVKNNGSENNVKQGASQNLDMDHYKSDVSVFQRYLLAIVKQSLERSEPRSFSGRVIILDGGHPLGVNLQDQAEKQGIRCVRVVDDDGGAVEDHHACVRLRFAEETDYEACYRHIKARYGTPSGVINLIALGKHSCEAGNDAVIQSFLWARTIGADRDLIKDNRWELFWISISGLGGDFGLNNNMDFEASQNGVHGLTKSLFHEWPGLQAKTIDIHPEENVEDLSRIILDECLVIHDTIKEICFFNGERHALTLIDQPHACGEIPPCFNSDSVFLITGGAKGITADVAVFLAKAYSPTLIAVGRTPLPERPAGDLESFLSRAGMGENNPRDLKFLIIKELTSSVDPVTPALVNQQFNAIMSEYKIRQNIAKMQHYGANVVYYACDCTDADAFGKLIRDIYSEFHKIDGVIHAAGCLKDGLITQKTTESFKQVLDTKVIGARVLLQELDFEHLEFMTFFSSVTGRFGNRGQADYAAANEILNKMAVKLNHQWPGIATAINWGPWEGEGMVSKQVKKQFTEMGVYLLPRDFGAQMLNREISMSDRPAEVVIFGATDVERRLSLSPVAQQTVNLEQKLAFAQLYKIISMSTDNSFCWELDLDRTAPYLNDHRINEVPVLSVSMAMEIMAQAGIAARPDYHFTGIQKFKLNKGITFNSQNPLKLMVTADLKRSGSINDLIADVRLILPSQINQSNYSCQVLLSKEKNGLIPGHSQLLFDQPFKYSVEEVYRHYLFHCGVFRGIKHIDSINITDLKNNGIRGVIEPSSPRRVIGDQIKGMWLIDPIAFDCAYQLALLWVKESYNSLALPSDLRKYNQYRSYDGGPIYCDVHIKVSHYPQLLMDFIFKDAHGELYAKATDAALYMSKGLEKQLRTYPN